MGRWSGEIEIEEDVCMWEKGDQLGIMITSKRKE